jgi:membrane protein implicated in regulation of membrane protease activity
VLGVLYLLGGLCLGLATFRAGVLPRWPAGLLAVMALLTPLAALLPHEFQRLAAVPMGMAFAWLGYALWSERRGDTSRVPQAATPALSQSAAG